MSFVDAHDFSVDLVLRVLGWRAVVDGAVRALAPGGVLILITTNRHHPFQGEVNHFPF
jgi:SAM-dependent methyltransferase